MLIGFVPCAVGPSTTGHGNFLNTGEAIRILATLGGNEGKCDALWGNQSWQSLCVTSWQKNRAKNCCSMFSFYKRRQLLQRQADIKQNAQDYTLRWQHSSESIHAWRQRPPQQAFPLTVANPGSLPNPATAFTICSKHSTSPKRLLTSPAFKIFTVFTKFWKHHKPLLNC